MIKFKDSKTQAVGFFGIFKPKTPIVLIEIDGIEIGSYLEKRGSQYLLYTECDDALSPASLHLIAQKMDSMNHGYSASDPIMRLGRANR